MSIIYTHLCAEMSPETILPQRTIDAMRRLAEYHMGGKILVTTTRRLLGYCRARSEVAAEYRTVPKGNPQIHLKHVDASGTGMPMEEEELGGLTFYVPDPAKTDVYWQGVRVKALVANPPDETGRPTLSIAWPPLEYPELN
jgi:hypothetical protein